MIQTYRKHKEPKMLFALIIVLLSFFAAFTAYKIIDAKKTAQQPAKETISNEEKNTRKAETSKDWLDKKWGTKTSTSREPEPSRQEKRKYSNVEYVDAEIENENKTGNKYYYT